MPKSVPNYLSVDPAGAVTALFTGGVRMPAAAAFNGAALRGDRSVRWTRGINGAMIGQVLTAENGAGSSILGIGAIPDGGDFFGANVARLSLYTPVGGLPAQVVAEAGAQTEYLVRSDGTSSIVTWTNDAFGRTTSGRRAGLLGTAQYSLGPFTSGVTHTYTGLPQGYYLGLWMCTGFTTAVTTGFLNCYFQGSPVGSTQLFFNEIEHHAFPTLYVPLGYNATTNATMTMSLLTNPASGTTSDGNDWGSTGLICL